MSKLGVITLVSLLIVAVTAGCTVNSSSVIETAVASGLETALAGNVEPAATATLEPVPTETPTPQPIGKAPTPKVAEVDTSVEEAVSATVKAMEIADAVDATVEAMASQPTETPTSEPTANLLPGGGPFECVKRPSGRVETESTNNRSRSLIQTSPVC